LKDDIKTIFKEVVRMGLKVGIIHGKDIFIDHTKIHANANPYKCLNNTNLLFKQTTVRETKTGFQETVRV
jgi:transposase